MSGDPLRCRMYAARYLRLANRAWRPEVRQVFIEMAATWTRLAAETESDQNLLKAISEIELGEPYDVLPNALKLRMGEYV
jgi:hypothetical protein